MATTDTQQYVHLPHLIHAQEEATDLGHNSGKGWVRNIVHEVYNGIHIELHICSGIPCTMRKVRGGNGTH